MKISVFGFTATRQFAAIAILASFVFSNVFAVNQLRGDKTNVVSSATAKYTTDLTQLGREGRLRAVLSFENETSRLVKVLAEGGVRQPVIVNEDKAVQDAIVEQVAIRIAKGQVPQGLAGKSILKLETANLFSNARLAAETAQVIDSIVSDVIESNGQTILFVDELTNFVGSDAASNNLFKAVAEGKLVMIGGSSAAAYGERIESKPEIAAFFAGILVSGDSNAGATAESNSKVERSEFRGDNVSPDMREMLANDSTGGTKRVDVIIQAKDAGNQSLRAIMSQNGVRLTDRIGNSDTLVVNLPLGSVNELSQSGLINYMSPDRATESTGHIEVTSGTSVIRSQPSGYGRAAGLPGVRIDQADR